VQLAGLLAAYAYRLIAALPTVYAVSGRTYRLGYLIL
jgi:hypothetical protein